MKNRILGVLAIIAILILIIPSNIFAKETVHVGIDTSLTIGNTNAINSSVGATQRIYGVLQVAGTIIAIIALIIIGMRYMFASVEQRAQMKGVIGYYVIGAILVFCTSNVLGFAYTIIDDTKHIYADIPGAAGIKKAPTCVSTGIKLRKCVNPECGHKESKPHIIEITIPAMGHSKSNVWQEKIAAKCEEDGVETLNCTLCHIEMEKRVIPKLGHSEKAIFPWSIKVEPTCTEKRNRSKVM